MQWSESLGRKAESALFWVGAPIFAAFMCVVTAMALPATVAAARGEGQPGTFVALRESCSRHGCDWYGTFTSDDGTIRLDDVLIDGGPERSGDQITALYEGQTDPPKVYKAKGSRDWMYVSGMFAGSLAFLVFWAVRLIAVLQGHRAPRSGRETKGP